MYIEVGLRLWRGNLFGKKKTTFARQRRPVREIASRCNFSCEGPQFRRTNFAGNVTSHPAHGAADEEASSAVSHLIGTWRARHITAPWPSRSFCGDISTLWDAAKTCEVTRVLSVHKEIPPVGIEPDYFTRCLLRLLDSACERIGISWVEMRTS